MAGNTKTAKARALGSMLKAARDERGIGLRELARRIGRDASVLSRWESGERSPTEAEAAKILGVLGINGARYEDILELTRNPDAPRWIALTLPEYRQHLNTALQFQREAQHIIELAPLLVPGLLQMEAYARAIMTAADVAEEEIGTRLLIRLGHQRILNHVRLTALVGETALHQQIGGPDVLGEQLRHLQHMANHENVIIRIVPFSADWNPALDGACTVIQTADGQTLVDVANRLSGQFLHAESDISTYQQAVKSVIDVAMSPEDSARLIAARIEQLGENRHNDHTCELA